jgi:hypothetical protein
MPSKKATVKNFKTVVQNIVKSFENESNKDCKKLWVDS